MHALAIPSSVDSRTEANGVRATKCWVCSGKGFLKISGSQQKCESCDGFGWLQSANAASSQTETAEKSANTKGQS